ncbi:MAG: T9SS type A sorting domain-containing protein [Bacteroidales bacterium]|nr:T9SS type A sorting domain-containing protein [Bacteroidales bacterium]
MFPCFGYSPSGDLVFNDYIGKVFWGFAFPIIGFHCKPLDEESHSLLLTDINDNGATVHWYSVEDGATYNVRLTSADGSIDSTVVTSDSSYAFYGLPTNHRYQVRVRKQCYYATASYDTTVYSPWTVVNTNFTLGVDTTGTGGTDTTGTGGGSGIDSTGTGGGSGGGDSSHTAVVMVGGADFSVSPNPVHGTLVVSFMQPLSEEGVLTLYDLGGREVRRMTVAAGSTKVDFDTEGCPAGAYLLKLITARGITTRRLLVE